MDYDELNPTPEDLDFKGITSRYSEIEGVVIDAARVPEAFRFLIPLAKHWSVGDDSERADLMWLTPYEELKTLVLVVKPLSDAMWAWTSSHHEDMPVPDEVVIFDMLQQAAAEADALHVDTES